jgi:hypothetical protein
MVVKTVAHTQSPDKCFRRAMGRRGWRLHFGARVDFDRNGKTDLIAETDRFGLQAWLGASTLVHTETTLSNESGFAQHLNAPLFELNPNVVNRAVGERRLDVPDTRCYPVCFRIKVEPPDSVV